MTIRSPQPTLQQEPTFYCYKCKAMIEGGLALMSHKAHCDGEVTFWEAQRPGIDGRPHY